VAKKQAERATFPIVAIGASAGGLDAFTSLLKGLPAHPRIGFVFIQHLEPTHASSLSRSFRRRHPCPWWRHQMA
jgi:two-component system CheB/CheR fusion protein